jgi:site-specific DNA-methyltransferase (cytosine-N4-specific)
MGPGSHNGKTGRYKNKQNESFCSAVSGLVEKRNKRSVWTVPTFAFPEAHFATFPPDLIKPCILAGSRPNDVILDPFLGSGTTALVSKEFGRKCVGIELNENYIRMAMKRTAQEVLPL